MCTLTSCRLQVNGSPLNTFQLGHSRTSQQKLARLRFFASAVCLVSPILPRRAGNAVLRHMPIRHRTVFHIHHQPTDIIQRERGSFVLAQQCRKFPDQGRRRRRRRATPAIISHLLLRWRRKAKGRTMDGNNTEDRAGFILIGVMMVQLRLRTFSVNRWILGGPVELKAPNRGNFCQIRSA